MAKLLAISFAAIGFLLGAEVCQAAQLAISLVGGAVGFLFGGPLGASIGFAAGSMLGNLLFPQKLPTVRGPQLSDLSVQSGAFGSHIPVLWGTDRIAAQVIFSSDLKPTVHKKKVGGKGFGGGASQSVESTTYAVDMMLSFGKRGRGVLRIWADTKLIYDVTGDPNLQKLWTKDGSSFTVRDGNENQLPSALEESYHGAGQCSAHRGLFCLEAADFQLANYGNRVPNFTAEVFSEGEREFGLVQSYAAPPPPFSSWMASWGYIDSQGEVWALYTLSATRAWYISDTTRVFHWSLSRPDSPAEEYHPLWSGLYAQTSSISSQVRLRSDEHSAMVMGSGGDPTYFKLASGLSITLSGYNGYFRPSIACKHGDRLWVANGTHWLYFNINANWLSRYDANTGVFQAASDVLLLNNSDQLLRDMGVSDSYLWILLYSKILKIDPDSFALLGQIDISTIENPLAMAVIDDGELRIFAATAAGSRFYVIRDGGAPQLDAHAPNVTYSGIRGFLEWGLRYLNGVYVVDFSGYISGFPALIDFFASTSRSFDIPLWKIVRDNCLMAGLDTTVEDIPPLVGELEVSELTDMVHGFTLSRSMSARDALTQLAFAYFFDCREIDLKLDFHKRGQAVVASLPGADLAARDSLTADLPARLTQNRGKETDLPLRLHLVFNNSEFSYQPTHVYAPRQITESRTTRTVQLAIALTSAEALRIANIQMAAAWLERETYQLRASQKYLEIDAADNIEVVITES